MGTIQDKLNILASTTEAAVQSLSQEELEEEKKNASVVDYKMVTFSLAGKDYAIDIMKVKEIPRLVILLMCLTLFLLFLAYTTSAVKLSR